MDEHPSVSIDCAGLRNGLPTLEECASLVLWGWPELLGWPRTIRWLFSPVVGKSPYPGDLWGIDERGELVIVETKLYRAGRAPDPFSDFLECSDHDDVRCHWEPAPLEKRWRDLLRAERQFCSKHATAFWSSPEPTEGLFRGVLPYSRHRKAAWQWPTLCKERLMPLFAAHDYEQAIESSLTLPRKSGHLDRAPKGAIGIDDVQADKTKIQPGVQVRGGGNGHSAWGDGFARGEGSRYRRGVAS